MLAHQITANRGDTDWHYDAAQAADAIEAQASALRREARALERMADEVRRRGNDPELDLSHNGRFASCRVTVQEDGV